jgi:hypothetical protein
MGRRRSLGGVLEDQRTPHPEPEVLAQRRDGLFDLNLGLGWAHTLIPTLLENFSELPFSPAQGSCWNYLTPRRHPSEFLPLRLCASPLLFVLLSAAQGFKPALGAEADRGVEWIMRP